jgi:hypothetical protein
MAARRHRPARLIQPRPTAGAVPWLLLRAKPHAATGVFTTVDFIVRAETQGGGAPASGCNAKHAGIRQSVSYTAKYIFLSGS